MGKWRKKKNPLKCDGEDKTHPHENKSKELDNKIVSTQVLQRYTQMKVVSKINNSTMGQWGIHLS